MRCITHLMLRTEVDAQCDKLAKIVGQTSTVASISNLVQLTVVVSLLH